MRSRRCGGTAITSLLAVLLAAPTPTPAAAALLSAGRGRASNSASTSSAATAADARAAGGADAGAGVSVFSGGRLKNSESPIRRLVAMLLAMKTKVEGNGKVDSELFAKYECYCKINGARLKKSIEDAEALVPQKESKHKEDTAEKDQLENKKQAGEEDLKKIEGTLLTMQTDRDNEAAEHTKETANLQANIDSLGKAIQALEDGREAGKFLQTETETVSVIRRLSTSIDMRAGDREMLTTFLSQLREGGDDSGVSYDMIRGILQQMKDTMEKDLSAANDAEAAAVKQYDGMRAAKETENNERKKQILTWTERIAALGIEIVDGTEDLNDAKHGLEEDRKTSTDLARSCGEEKKKYDAFASRRAEESLAIAETIKLLNNEEALELFKGGLATKSGSGAAGSALSLLQTASRQPAWTADAKRREALEALRAGSRGGRLTSPRLQLVATALRGRRRSFDKVLAMIDSMVQLLKKEQVDDTAKRDTCTLNIQKAVDEKKDLDSEITSLGKVVDTTEEKVRVGTEAILALENAIQESDKNVESLTKLRKEENQEYTQEFATGVQMKELLGRAKDRLQRYYNEKKSSQSTLQLSAQEQVMANLGGGPLSPLGGSSDVDDDDGAAAVSNDGAAAGARDAPKDLRPPTTGAAASSRVPPPTARRRAPSLTHAPEASFLQLASVADAAQTPLLGRPDGLSEKYNQADETGVIALFDQLMQETDEDIEELKSNENLAQADYEKAIQEAADKRASDARSVSFKEGVKADNEANLHETQGRLKQREEASQSKATILEDLHKQCDWLIANFGVRKSARTTEIEALNQATAVLSGASSAFTQLKRGRRGLRQRRLRAT